uniref:Uncharacterized protein n=1 Tax=Nothobranchius kadleci TaxID=1051664 RepID=A0A1A8BVW2_NOTKA
MTTQLSKLHQDVTDIQDKTNMLQRKRVTAPCSSDFPPHKQQSKYSDVLLGSDLKQKSSSPTNKPDIISQDHSVLPDVQLSHINLLPEQNLQTEDSVHQETEPVPEVHPSAEPSRMFLGHLLPKKKGGKALVPVKLTQNLFCDAPLDTSSDFSLVTRAMFDRIRISCGRGLGPQKSHHVL